MRVVCTVVAALWLAVVGSRADGNLPGRCCPSLFKVDPDPREFQFRCEVANLTDGCDNLTMREKVPNTAINTDEGLTECSNSYLMTDPNWQDMEDFQPNIACAYYLPPVVGCRWVLELLKPLDPIVCGNNCECDCEDNVSFEEVDSQSGSPDKKTYCDFTPLNMMEGNSMAGWCANSIGPDNVQGTLPFSATVNTGVLTTFRSDNINGAGDGAFVFAYAVPVMTIQTRASQPQPSPQQPSAGAPSLRRTFYCWKHYILCKYKRRTCSMPCECYSDTQRRISCTLYEIFTDTTGRAARKNYNSSNDVIRRAARHALLNITRFGRPIPTFSQLRNSTPPGMRVQ